MDVRFSTLFFVPTGVLCMTTIARVSHCKMSWPSQQIQILIMTCHHNSTQLLGYQTQFLANPIAQNADHLVLQQRYLSKCEDESCELTDHPLVVHLTFLIYTPAIYSDTITICFFVKRRDVYLMINLFTQSLFLLSFVRGLRNWPHTNWNWQFSVLRFATVKSIIVLNNFGSQFLSQITKNPRITTTAPCASMQMWFFVLRIWEMSYQLLDDDWFPNMKLLSLTISPNISSLLVENLEKS